VLGRLGRGLRALLHLLARPVRATRSQGEIVLQTYRGYGTRQKVFVIGRAFRQPAGHASPEGLWGDLRDLWRRFWRRSIADAPLVARLGEAEQRLRTDRDGYFRVHLAVDLPPLEGDHWHEMDLELLDPPGHRAKAEVFVPPSACRFVVISDIDDTIMKTGVANKAVMLWRLFMQGAEGRVAFPGVAALLRGLHHGVSGSELNPMLYVSRAPWSIYEILDAFFHLHRIPVGPLLFLREWGLTFESPLPRRAKGHKLELIGNMLALYRDLPFVLIGDSGQRDPEIYARIVHEHPGRVLAIYIRNVSRQPERQRAIEDLAVEVVEAGSSLLLAADSMAIARHAAEHGLIAPQALAEVAGEKDVQDDAETGPTRVVEAPTAHRAEDAIQHGALADALEQRSGAAPANIEVEGTDARRAHVRSQR
jgi:phosphatidate phosphatase APP1